MFRTFFAQQSSRRASSSSSSASSKFGFAAAGTFGVAAFTLLRQQQQQRYQQLSDLQQQHQNHVAFCNGEAKPVNHHRTVQSFAQWPDSIAVTIDPETGLELHTLVPPCITDEEKHIVGFVPCQRPARSGGAKVEREVIDVTYVGAGSATPDSSDDKNSNGSSDEDSSSSAAKEQKQKSTFKRTIYHNTGHGGGGWSNGPGCVDYLMNIFDSTTPAVPRDEPIAILGAGIIGLFTAWSLLRRGYSNITVVASQDHDLCSHNAAGLFGVFAVSPEEDPHRSKLFQDAAVYTVEFYNKIMSGELGPSDGFDNERDKLVKVLPRYMAKREFADDCSHAIKTGQMREPTEVLVRFKLNDDNNTNTASFGTQRRMWIHRDAIFFDVVKLMDSLSRYVFSKSYRVKQQARFIQRLDQAIVPATLTTANDAAHSTAQQKELADHLLEDKFKIIFNCTGAGSNELTGGKDNRTSRVGGHLINLQNQPDGALDYFFDFRRGGDVVKDAEDGRRTHRMLYYFPKGGGLLGGTMVEKMEEGEMFALEEFERIIQEAKEIFSS